MYCSNSELSLPGTRLTCICPGLSAPSWRVSSWYRPPWGHSSRWAHGLHPPQGVWGLQVSGLCAYGWMHCKLDRHPLPDPSWPGGGRLLRTTPAGQGKDKERGSGREKETLLWNFDKGLSGGNCLKMKIWRQSTLCTRGLKHLTFTSFIIHAA